jgi:tRNA modification GTPase
MRDVGIISAPRRPREAMNRDTIFALSSGHPPAAVAVVRVSGPRARAALECLVGRVPEPRRAALARVRDPEAKEPIDQALVLWFPGPASETGEDMAELQLHGGRAVIAATLAALGRLDGFRLAEPGEFTRRAFENGRLDLTAVEGLADLIGAETEAQRRQAFRQLTGLLGGRAANWRAQLIEALALVEAGIDFADEGDVPDGLTARAAAIAAALRAELAVALADADRGERLRTGLVVAIAGPPNAGKSTLFNALARRDVAIVSPYPGTTRDVLEVHLDLGGFPVTVLDTAGIRETADPVERIGVARAQARATAADLVLWVTDVFAPEPPQQAAEVGGAALWAVRNKIDLAPEPEPARPGGFPAPGEPRFAVSAKKGIGIHALLGALRTHAEASLSAGEPALVVRERQRLMLREAHDALARAGASGSEEVVAEELRLAARALGKLLGAVDVEDVLDRIFGEFCIGK